jgi:hypothetical protein
MSITSVATATNVVPFPRARRMDNRFSALDRIEILRWSEGAQQEGYVRVVVHAQESQNDPEIGDFLLIHRRDRLWATWGLGCTEGGFLVWHPGTGRTVGWFPVLREALGVIVAVP